MSFNDGKVSDFGIPDSQLIGYVEKGDAFKTTGCPDCNRPYATETHKEIFNFPKDPNPEEIVKIKQQLGFDGW